MSLSENTRRDFLRITSTAFFRGAVGLTVRCAVMLVAPNCEVA
jgi:hypothetical protein